MEKRHSREDREGRESGGERSHARYHKKRRVRDGDTGKGKERLSWRDNKETKKATQRSGGQRGHGEGSEPRERLKPNLMSDREVAETYEQLDVAVEQNAMEEGHGVRESCGQRKKGWNKWTRPSTLVCRVGVVPTMIEQSTIREQLTTWKT